MILKTKTHNWVAGLPVAMLSKETADHLGLQPKEMILIKTISRHPKDITAVLDIIEKEVRRDQILLSAEVVSKLGLKNGDKVDVNISPVPRSVDFIKKKLSDKKLSKTEIQQIVMDIVHDRLSEAEIALFVAAMYQFGMSNKETIYLINAIIKTGNRLSLKEKLVVDKHSVGGVAGNRTTPIVVSICAAAGLTFPKTSSRAITSAAGTADVIEAVAQVDFTIPELKKIIKKTHAFIIWGGGMGVVPADSKIIKVEKMLNIDPKSQLLASIMSKKFAVGSKYILIDIPYGRGAKIPTKRKAEELKRKFSSLGRYFHRDLRCVLTDGSQPIGNGVGPMMELRDIIKILDPNVKGPLDLQRKGVFLAANLLEMSGKAKKGHGQEMAEKLLYSGKAFEKFKQIIKAQHGSLARIRYARYKKDILSQHNGKIARIDNKLINNLGRVAGSPVDKPAGLYLYYHVGDSLKKGDKLITIYSETKTRLAEAVKFFKDNQPIKFH